MNMNVNQISASELRGFLSDLIFRFNPNKNISDNESLFMSGLLDSFSAMQLVLHLEELCGVDFSLIDFDVEKLDSIEKIMKFLENAPRIKS